MQKQKIDFHAYQYEQKLWQNNALVCGIDEVGRGCLAGPVVAAAAILHPNSYHPLLKDSKVLNGKQLLEAYQWLLNHSFYAVTSNNARIVDQKNIYRATRLTMKQALLHLCTQKIQLPELILIDALTIALHDTPYQVIKQEALIKGESKSASIAAASIIAKVTRDRLLQRMHHDFPSYHLQQHKGYATSLHQKMMHQYQPSLIHRTTFLKKFKHKEHADAQISFLP